MTTTVPNPLGLRPHHITARVRDIEAVFSVPDPDRLQHELVAKGVRVTIYGPKPTPVKTFVFHDCECGLIAR